MNSILFKNFMIVTVSALHQFSNGFSGFISFPDFMLALFQINMTLFLQSSYVSIHKDVSFEKYGTSIEAEQKLPFKMAHLYKSRKQHVSRFLLDYLCGTIWGILCGAFMFYQFKFFEDAGGIGL